MYLESSGRYTIIFTINKEKIVACKNLGFYQKIFENQNFIRVHNSFLVNFEFVTEIIKDSLKLIKSSVPSNIKLIQEFNLDNDLISADPIQIQQIIINICNCYRFF